MNQKKFSIVKNESETSQILVSALEKELLALRMVSDEKHPDIVFTVGGDGTFLKAISQFNKVLDQVAFISINTGNIGFNVTFTSSDVKKIIDNLKSNNLVVRYLDAVEIKTKKTLIYGLNEVKLVTILKTMNFDVYINNVFLQHCQSSGFTVGTKAGSTGFIKSIKGAIIVSDKKLMQFLEIAGVEHQRHNSLNAPLIFDDSHTITIKGNFFNPSLVIDSILYDFNSDEINVKLIPNKIKILVDREHEFNTIKQLQKTFIF